MPKIKRDSIVYRHELVDMDESPESYFSGDDDDDRNTCAWIRKELAAGNVAAWCGAVVTATLHGFEAKASLWACSYVDEKQVWESHQGDLESEARLSLVAEVERTEENVRLARRALEADYRARAGGKS